MTETQASFPSIPAAIGSANLSIADLITNQSRLNAAIEVQTRSSGDANRKMKSMSNVVASVRNTLSDIRPIHYTVNGFVHNVVVAISAAVSQAD